MSDTIGNKTVLSCDDAMLRLESQVAEEILSIDDQQALNAHLRDCPKCRPISVLMTALPMGAKLDTEQFNTDLDSAYALLQSKRRQKQRTRHGVMLFAGLAAAVILWMVTPLHNLIRPSKQKQNISIASACIPTPLVSPAKGIVMTTCRDAALDISTDTDGTLRVALDQGTVGLRVNPNRPDKHPVLVETPHGAARVKGTVFAAQVDTAHTLVEVFRGVVACASTGSSNKEIEVHAGQRGEMPGRQVDVFATAVTARIRQALFDTQNDMQLAHHPSLPNDNSMAKIAAPSIAPTETTDTVRKETPPSIPKKRTERNAQRATRVPVSKPLAKPLNELIQDAQTCLLNKDWNGASDAYKTIIKQYPRHSEATTVLISLARIELHQLGRPKQALKYYRSYQKKAPNGSMAEEALFGVIKSYQQLGRITMEREALERFINRYPNSSQIPRVHKRLRQLKTD